jgi:hypothetical protein
VADQNGVPLSGAEASFGGFTIGGSDSGGRITGGMPCGSYQLRVSKSGYDFYTTANTTNPNGTYALYKKIGLTLNMSFVDMNGTDDPHGAAEPYPNMWLGQLSYERCAVSPAASSVTVNLTSGRMQYMIPNLDSAASTNTDCAANTNCITCTVSPSNSAACAACLACRSSGFVYRPVVSVDYVTGGGYAFNVQELGAGMSSVKGALYTNYNVPFSSSTLNIYIPSGSDALLFNDIAYREQLVDKLRRDCLMEPIVANTTTYGSVIRMTGCSPSQLRAMIGNELGSCINTAQLDNLFQASSTLPTATWIFKTAKADVLAAIRGCGYTVTGC